MLFRLIGGQMDGHFITRSEPEETVCVPIDWDKITLKMIDPNRAQKKQTTETAVYRRMRACVGSNCKTFFVFDEMSDDEELIIIDKRGYL